MLQEAVELCPGLARSLQKSSCSWERDESCCGTQGKGVLPDRLTNWFRVKFLDTQSGRKGLAGRDGRAVSEVQGKVGSDDDVKGEMGGTDSRDAN